MALRPRALLLAVGALACFLYFLHLAVGYANDFGFSGIRPLPEYLKDVAGDSAGAHVGEGPPRPLQLRPGDGLLPGQAEGALTEAIVSMDPEQQTDNSTLSTTSGGQGVDDHLASIEASPTNATESDEAQALREQAKVQAAEESRERIEALLAEADRKPEKSRTEMSDEELERHRNELNRARDARKQAVIERLNGPDGAAYADNLRVEDHDIGVIVRTGYEVQYRLEGALGSFLAGKDNHTFIASDIESEFEGQKVFDTLARLADRPEVVKSNRYQYYESMRSSLVEQKKGDAPYDYEKKETAGWELDVLKCFSGIHMGYEHLGPDYKWYLVVDDDTWVHYPSLKSVLSRLDYQSDLFIGNGAWMMGGIPYAHGGAGIVISQGAMKTRFVDHADSLGHVNDRAATTRYADHLLSVAMDEIDIPVDNMFRISFHEHDYHREPLHGHDFGKPTVTYHHLSPLEMRDLDNRFGDRPFEHTELQGMLNDPDELFWKHDWSYNLEKDDSSENKDSRNDLVRFSVDSRHRDSMDANRCQRLCVEIANECLAWTFIEEEENNCFMTTHFRMGYAKRGAVSGVNKELFEKRRAESHGYP